MNDFSFNYPVMYSLNIHIQSPQGNYIKFGEIKSLTTSSEAFSASLHLLKNIMPSADIFIFEAVGNSTTVRECTEDGVYVCITPNILQKNTKSIGPYSLRLQKFLEDLPEN